MSRELKDSYLLKQFMSDFDKLPAYLIKAPGRINLIGEHTDYNGFPVMPAAIPFTITAAVSPRTDSTVNIKNTDFSFKPLSFDISADIPHSPDGDWSNYVKAAVNELSLRLKTTLYGMDVIFHGDIPSSAGLSSSSALVIASALSLLAVNNIDMDSVELAETMAYGEHYVGTQGGGMDQAICILGRKNHAIKIDFFPLRHTRVSFPDGYSVVAAHSLVRAAKTENALLLYNRRPAECRLATVMINAVRKVDPPLTRLGDLVDRKWFDLKSDNNQLIDSIFDREAYALEDIAYFTGETVDSLTHKCLMTRSGVPMPAPADGFHLRARALHVLTEARRVEDSVDVLGSGDARGFGLLMNASHESCDKLYGISTPELNRLVEIMRELGALGARLTGAGFGGCAIGLVRDDDVNSVIDGIRELYYDGYIRKNRSDLAGTYGNTDALLFSVKPADGAMVIRL